MRSSKKRLVEKDGLVYAQGKVWTKEQHLKFRQYQNEYNRNRYQLFGLRFNKETDQEIIDYLKAQDNLTDYFRKVVLADMKKHKKK